MKTFTKPPVGAQITVTTRYREDYYYATNKWRDTVHSGVVINDERWTPPGSFCMTSDEPNIISFRTIALHNVIDMKIGDEAVKAQDIDPSTKYVTVSGNKGNQYVVTVKDGTPTHCTCPGFHFRGRCRHLKGVDLNKQNSDNRSTLNSHKGKHIMSNLKSPDLSWPERFAIIDHFNLDDATATAAFGVTNDELTTARDLKAAGTIKVAEGINYADYESELTIKTPKAIKKAEENGTSKPKTITATKPIKTLKKRGRKGSKIISAFRAVPKEPVTVSAFTAEHGVSVPVLRQWKRFDKTGLPGQVRVRKDKASGELMVWRDSEAK